MPDLLAFSNTIKKSADDYLADHKTFQELSKLGEVQIVGSYLYNLMTWKNLDILIISDKLSRDAFYALGQYFFKAFNPKSAKFEDKTDSNSPANPSGYYWEIVTQDEWVLDVWYITKQEAQVQKELRDQVFSGLDDKKRRLIISLKLSPEYRISYTAIDVYNAVLQDNVTSLRDFQKWLGNRLI